MNVKGILETVYSIVKGYMIKKIVDTGNQKFIDDSNNAFKAIETIWEQVVAKK